MAEKDDGAPEGWLNRTVIGAGLTSGLGDFCYETTTVILPDFISVLGIPAAVLGLVEGAADVVAAFTKMLSGYIPDKLGHRKRLVLIGYALTPLGQALIALAAGWPLLLLGRIVSWFGKGRDPGSAGGDRHRRDGPGGYAGHLLWRAGYRERRRQVRLQRRGRSAVDHGLARARFRPGCAADGRGNAGTDPGSRSAGWRGKAVSRGKKPGGERLSRWTGLVPGPRVKFRSRYGRGIMRASGFLTLALLFSSPAFAAHPLTSDDAGVLGAGQWQLEANTDRAVAREAGAVGLAVNATLTRGMTDAVDLAINLSWCHSQADAAPGGSQRGLGDASLALKWRVLERGGLSLGVKPWLVLPTGRSDKGFGAERVQAGVLGILGFAADETHVYLGNVGYLRANNGTGGRRDIWNASAAALIASGVRLRFVAETGAHRNPDSAKGKNPVFANVGAIYSPSEKLDLDFGYRRGLNDAEAKYSAGAGLTLRW
ncbi:transporter [Niveibacterium terrae]|uniref:transporter n=1 Tax=Niveibacterium terrae TaxID=3373598 RepID=UPI003A8F8B12